MKTLTTKLFAIFTLVALCFSLAACNVTPDNDPPEVGEPTTYVAIEINPSIELTLDENGVVATVRGTNEDGAVLLLDEEANIIGKGYEAAAEYITKLADELGYIKEGHEIETSVIAKDEAAAEAIKEKLNAKITSTAESLGVAVTITKDTAYAILRELRELKEKYPDNASIQSLTPDRYKLVVSATEGGDITIEAAVELDTEELINKVNDTHEKIKGYATDLYNEARARAEMTYELAMGIALDGIYNTVYMARLSQIILHPEYKDTFYYGAVYQAYMTTARTYDALERIIELGEEMTNYELSEDTVNAIAGELGIEDTAVLANKDGKVTVKSVIAYLDEYIDEHELQEEVEDRIEEILDEAEDAAEMAALASDAYKADLEALKAQIEAIITTINSTAQPFLALLSEEAKADLEACIADLNATALNITAIMQNGLTEEEIDALADAASEKAEAMYERIKADLSEEELEAIENLRAKAEESITTLTNQFKDRLTAAENQAKQQLAKLREEREAASKAS
ncbi:MAG: hypothetical protein IKC87_05240 [Clostridia bacterium]|nr:hypothetical protein [Clostridia bacterium]